jgi:hypothetical protein
MLQELGSITNSAIIESGAATKDRSPVRGCLRPDRLSVFFLYKQNMNAVTVANVKNEKKIYVTLP